MTEKGSEELQALCHQKGLLDEGKKQRCVECLVNHPLKFMMDNYTCCQTQFPKLPRNAFISFEKYSAITTSWIVVPKLVGSKSGNAQRGEEIFGFLQRIRSHLHSRQQEDP